MDGVRTIVLVGLMGTGKTTIGRLLAGRLGWPFVDSDAILEQRHGRTARDLGRSVGTVELHAREARGLLDLLGLIQWSAGEAIPAPGSSAASTRRAPESSAGEVTATPTGVVVAAAASVVDEPACRRALRGPGVVVAWLQADPQVLARRFTGGVHRPWHGDDPAAFLAAQATLRRRRFLALRPAVTIDTERAGPEAATEAILAAIQETVQPPQASAGAARSSAVQPPRSSAGAAAGLSRGRPEAPER
jgi:shikimate kinase